MSDPSSSTAYRNPTVEEEDDDLDDLDGMLWLLGKGADLADVLASFNKPTTAAPQTPGPSSSRPRGGSADTNLADASPQAARVGAGGADEEDFEASLVEGMESLLRQLAGDHPPGPAPGETKIDGVASRSAAGPGGPAGTSGLSPAEEEEAWQKALEMMLSGEGLSALGIDPASAMAGAKGSGALATAGGPSQSNAPPRPAGQPGAADQPSFEETIRRTMESLKTGGEGSRAAASGEASDLAKLLEQLGSDPSLLDGLGNGDGDELGGLLDGMMSQLMTKEVLEEPMAELASKVSSFCPPLPPLTFFRRVTQC